MNDNVGIHAQHSKKPAHCPAGMSRRHVIECFKDVVDQIH